MNLDSPKKLVVYGRRFLFQVLFKKKYSLASVVLSGLAIWSFSLERTESHRLHKDRSPKVNQASLSNSTRSLSPNFFCTNNNALRVTDWSDPNFVRAVNRLKPSMIRFPGGTVANYWDWHHGGLIEAFREGKDDFFYSFSVKDSQFNDGTLRNFRQGLDLTNTEPVLVLNMSTSDLESQLEMLRTAKEEGLPIKYIELGNELYIDVEDNREIFPQPKDYAERASEWISAIKAEFPQAKIAVVGVIPSPKKPERLQAWNQSLIPQTLSKADAIVLHIYAGHALGKKADNRQTYPFFDPADTKIILGQPFVKWQRVRDYPQFQLLPSDRQIWITEYNLFEDIFYGDGKGKKPKVMGSWAHGLFAITMSLLFLEESRVEFICNHQLINNFNFGSILPKTNSFIDPVTGLALAEPYSLSASGSALSMFGNAIDGMNQATAIEFDDAHTALGHNEFEYPTLYGWKFTNQKQQNSLILNLSNRYKTIEISSLIDRNARYETIFGSPRDLIAKPGTLKQKTGRANRTMILPPYSVTKISSSK